MKEVKAKMFSNTTEIGHINLRVLDMSMGVLGGVFNPNDNYQKIRSTIQKSHQDTAKKVSLLAGLILNIQFKDGYYVFQVFGIDILDVDAAIQEPIQVDVAGVSRYTMEYYFENNSQLVAFKEPWGFLNLRQKIAFEKELMLELGQANNSRFFGLLKPKKSNHILANATFSAMANTGMNDDVLFEIHGSEFEAAFAIVHLTWRGKQEIDSNWPTVMLLKDFEAFKRIESEL